MGKAIVGGLDTGVIRYKDIRELPPSKFIFGISLGIGHDVHVSGDSIVLSEDASVFMVMRGGEVVFMFSPELTWHAFSVNEVDLVTVRQMREDLAKSQRELDDFEKETEDPLSPDAKIELNKEPVVQERTPGYL